MDRGRERNEIRNLVDGFFYKMVLRTLYIIHSVQYTVYSTHYTVYSTHYTVYSTHYTVFSYSSTQCTRTVHCLISVYDLRYRSTTLSDTLFWIGGGEARTQELYYMAEAILPETLSKFLSSHFLWIINERTFWQKEC